MKKIYSIALSLFLGASSMMAQTGDVHFVTIDADVNKTGDVADGAEITVNTVTDDGFGSQFISTGLGVENTSDTGKRVQIVYDVLTLDNGAVQCCFSTCKSNNAVGTYYTPMLSSSGNSINLPVVKKNGGVNDLAGEWFFTADGKAKVKFTIKIGTENTSKSDPEGKVYDVVDGPSVTVNFVKGNVSGISAATVDDAVATTWYDMAGRKVSSPVKGIYMQKTVKADGTALVKKVAVK